MAEKTRRLYFEDPYRTEFEAQVIERLTYQGQPALVLDRTCFYPEGGGQPDDRGKLNGIVVTRVIEENDKILHLLEKDIPESRIKGKIDWSRRFDHMQQHAGQHILSQCFVRLHGAGTRSFHLGEKTSTLEIDLRNIDDEGVERTERMANGIVFQDKEIKTRFFREEKLADVPLRRPPQKQGEIRVVEVSEFDHTACGGTHPHRTGEIGIIKILRWDRIRDNVRLEFICGGRALEDYIRKNRDLRELSNRMTIDDKEVLGSYEKLVSDLKMQKKTNKKLREVLIQYEAEEITGEVRDGIIQKIFTEKTPEEARSLALAIIRKGDFVVLFGVGKEERVHIFLARSESLDIDLRELVPMIASLIGGRGGGRPSLVEIAGEKKENLSVALEKAYALISSKKN